MSAAEADAVSPITTAEARSLFASLTDLPTVIVAVSGGPDSTALLYLLARWRRSRRRGPSLVAVTIDHGLRPEAAREARNVKRLAATLGVAHRTMRWMGPKPLTGLPDAARVARYRLLAEAARKADATHILTAHTLDDQAETVLMRLTRGSGITGLGGMLPETDLPGGLTLARPLLPIAKARLIATCAKARLPVADDPTNRDPLFTRPRLRQAMPALAAEGLTTVRLAVLAGRMRRADAALEAAVSAVEADIGDGPIPIGDLPDEIALRLIRRAILRVGQGNVELAKLEALFDSGRDGRRARRTLAGALVTLAGRTATVETAPPRGVHPPKGLTTGRKRLPKR